MNSETKSMSVLSSKNWGIRIKRIEIIKNHRSDSVPCSNDLNCTTPLIQSFLKTTTRQHPSLVLFLRGQFSCSAPWQLSLTRFCNGLNRHGRITSCFSRVVSWQYLQGLQICCNSRSKRGSHNLLATRAATPRFWHWDCCILPFDRALERKTSND